MSIDIATRTTEPKTVNEAEHQATTRPVVHVRESRRAPKGPRSSRGSTKAKKASRATSANGTRARGTSRTAAPADPDLSSILKIAAPLFHLTSDETRLGILLTLAQGEHNVGQLCAVLTRVQPNISYHLAILRISGLVELRRAGKCNEYGLTVLGRRLVKAAVELTQE